MVLPPGEKSVCAWTILANLNDADDTDFSAHAVMLRSKNTPMKIQQSTLCLSFVLAFFAAASRPAQAAGCTEAKMKADRQHVGAIQARGHLRILRYAGVSVSPSFWRSMSHGQKKALGDRIVCAVMGPNDSVYAVKFVVNWPARPILVGVWTEGALQEFPLPRVRP